jgi:hypothetical protein
MNGFLTRRQWVQASIVVSVSAVTLACLGSNDPSSSLWIPAEATILRPATVYRSGNAEVSFTVAIAEFNDRDAFTARLTKQIEGSGWRRRSWQYLNPTHPLSFEWERGGGGVRIQGHHPKRTVETRLWRGEWDDADGNVLEYSLLAMRVAEGPGHGIRAFAAYIPAALALAGEKGDFR